MEGIKITNKLMITKSTMVTQTWRHKWNFVFLASSNSDERTCGGREGSGNRQGLQVFADPPLSAEELSHLLAHGICQDFSQRSANLEAA